MNIWPLRFREHTGSLLFADESGAWFRADEAFLQRYAEDRLTPDDQHFLDLNGHTFGSDGDLSQLAFAWRWTARQAKPHSLAYVMLIPTLRCNLACGYCQVSRAAEGANGYDWEDTTVDQVLRFLDDLDCDDIKVEFQGGEPLLRIDLLIKVRDFCRSRFRKSQFVVCTNLQEMNAERWSFLEGADTFTSTSIDGDKATHTRQRTGSAEATDTFFTNVQMATHVLGSGKVSALPTIDVNNAPDMEALVSTYESLGIRSIYLRPINYQGFARKRQPPAGEASLWNKLYFDFIERLIVRNAATGTYMEEYYFTHCLRRVLSAGLEHHVDIRNPNLLGEDYVVVDYDGVLYPTDEARMLARIGHSDLSIGHISTGIDRRKTAEINCAAGNNYNPDCIHCPYQPFCGTDLIDDLSRYGRIDLQRDLTWFCQRHLAIFDKIFELIFRDDDPTRRSLARWAGVVAWPSALAVVHS